MSSCSCSDNCETKKHKPVYSGRFCKKKGGKTQTFSRIKTGKAIVRTLCRPENKNYQIGTWTHPETGCGQNVVLGVLPNGTTGPSNVRTLLNTTPSDEGFASFRIGPGTWQIRFSGRLRIADYTSPGATGLPEGPRIFAGYSTVELPTPLSTEVNMDVNGTIAESGIYVPDHDLFGESYNTGYRFTQTTINTSSTEYNWNFNNTVVESFDEPQVITPALTWLQSTFNGTTPDTFFFVCHMVYIVEKIRD